MQRKSTIDDVKAGGGAPSLNLIVYWGGTPQKHRCIQNKYNTIQYNVTLFIVKIEIVSAKLILGGLGAVPHPITVDRFPEEK